MKEPLVVGVVHDTTAHCLLNRACRKEFTERVFPLIDRNTLLLIEGPYRESYREERSPLYFFQHWAAMAHVGVPIGRPTIGWRDGRHLVQHPYTVYRETLESLTYANKQTRPRIVLSDDTPTTFAELCGALFHAELAYHMTGEDDAQELFYGTRLLRSFLQFDKSMIAAACEWWESGRHAIILCGGLHALTIHRTTGWPTIHLGCETASEVEKLTRDFIANVLYPEVVLEKTLLIPK